MQKNSNPLNHLLAQAPSLFGFNPEDSVLVFFGNSIRDDHFELGPTIRIDIPRTSAKGVFRLSLKEALRKLAPSNCPHLYIAIVRKGWHHPSRFSIIEQIEHVCSVVAHSQNYVIKDVVVLEECVSNGEWVSVFTGVSGLVDEVESSPLALERYWDGVDIGQDRDTTRRQLLQYIDDVEIAEAWAGASSLSRHNYDESYLQHCLNTSANAAYDSPEAQYMRSYFLQTIESYQSCDGLMALLVTSHARVWTNWMWALLPTYDQHDKAMLLYVLAVWQYMRGDGFRCEVLIDKAESYATDIVGLATVKSLLALCIEPEEIINVVKGIASRLEQSA